MILWCKQCSAVILDPYLFTSTTFINWLVRPVRHTITQLQNITQNLHHGDYWPTPIKIYFQYIRLSLSLARTMERFRYGRTMKLKCRQNFSTSGLGSFTKMVLFLLPATMKMIVWGPKSSWIWFWMLSKSSKVEAMNRLQSIPMRTILLLVMALALLTSTAERSWIETERVKKLW